MLLERIYDEDLAQASYVIGCQAAGEAVVVDPRRDVQVYLDLAAARGLRISHVTETHIHADYLSGSRELAAATGASVHVSAEGGTDWQYGFDAERLHHGDRITVGAVTLEARHTPGHTPEHLMFLVTDGAVTGHPGYALTGDFVFAGDLGRPDLLDAVAGGEDSRFAGARDLFASLRREFLTLPDHVQVFPAHGAGSACGKALGALPSTTVGYERLTAWWARHLEAGDEDAFVAELLEGQSDAHEYFGRMKRENRDGPAVIGERTPVAPLAPAEVASLLAADEAILVDTRGVAENGRGAVERSLSLPVPGKAASHGAWVYDPEREQRPVVLLARDQEQAQELADHLLRVGVDRVAGYTDTLDGLPASVPATVAPADLADLDPALLLDVRTRTEHAAGHVPGSEQLSAGRLLWHLDALPAEGAVVTYCQSGVRNRVVASALRRAGVDVVELEGSYLGWQAWKGRQQQG